jgi:hypothetical protein
LTNATWEELHVVVREWHRRALPTIRTKDFSTTWSDFTLAWEKPLTTGFFAAAAVAADGVVLGGLAGMYDGPLCRLAKLVASLQEQAGERPFYLSCRKAGKYLGVGKTDANKMLNTLKANGVLLLVTKGEKATGKASVWRYIGGSRITVKPKTT